MVTVRFKSSKNILDLLTFSQNVAILEAMTLGSLVSEMAALSYKLPCLVLHKGKIILCPRFFFLQKAVSAFHLNEDIMLPNQYTLWTQSYIP